MSKSTVSDFVIDRLIAWDLHRFYGFPGDGIGGFDGALERAEPAHTGPGRWSRDSPASPAGHPTPRPGGR